MKPSKRRGVARGELRELVLHRGRGRRRSPGGGPRPPRRSGRRDRAGRASTSRWKSSPPAANASSSTHGIVTSDGPGVPREARVAQLVGAAARLLALLEDDDVVARALQAQRRAEAAEARADDDDPHASASRGRAPRRRRARTPTPRSRSCSTSAPSASVGAARLRGDEQRPRQPAGARAERQALGDVDAVAQAAAGEHRQRRARRRPRRAARRRSGRPSRRTRRRPRRRAASRRPSIVAQFVPPGAGDVDRGDARRRAARRRPAPSIPKPTSLTTTGSGRERVDDGGDPLERAGERAARPRAGRPPGPG